MRLGYLNREARRRRPTAFLPLWTGDPELLRFFVGDALERAPLAAMAMGRESPADSGGLRD
jgi:hypothetical protein